jgi:hypothetical protein
MVMRRGVAAALLAGVLGTGACSGRAEETLPPPVKAVVELTKTPKMDYAVYNWNRIETAGGPIEEWSAEFHSGNLHRVETPRDRMIADCMAGTGTGLSLATGEKVVGAKVALAACGVNTNKAFVFSEWQGVVDAPFGKAQRIRLVDASNVRIYDVMSDGAIVRTKYNLIDGSPLSLTYAVAIEHERPDPAMFDAASLTRSYVPDRFKTAPVVTTSAGPAAGARAGG